MQPPVNNVRRSEEASLPLEQREDWYSLPELMRQSKYRRVLLPHLEYRRRDKPRRKSYAVNLLPGKVESGIYQGEHGESTYSYIFMNKTLSKMLYQTVDELKDLTHSQSALVYLYNTELKKLILAPRNVPSSRCMVTQPIRKYLNLSSYIALEKRFLMIEDVLKEFRIPQGFGQYGYSDEGALIKSVLGVPILSPEEELIGVVEFCRNFRQPVYTDKEAEIVVSAISCTGAAIDQHLKLIQYRKQTEVHSFLSNLMKNACLEEVAQNDVLMNIVAYAKKETGSERVSYLIIDHSYDEAVADYTVENTAKKWESSHTTKKVRLDPARSLMAWVAATREKVNIANTEKDKRVHMKLDFEQGTIRRSILCMPIVLGNKVFGVIQMINKLNSLAFSECDEDILSICCQYCSIGLSFRGHRADSKLWRNLVSTLEEMTIYQLTNNVLEYNTVIPPNVSKSQADELLNFRWTPKDEGRKTLSCVLHMFSELYDGCNDNIGMWSAWLIRVKKCYREDAAYHNFSQALISCHLMYNLLVRHRDLFSRAEIISLMISSLCHNVDHQGLQNSYYQVSQHSLAQLHQNFSLENHHFEMTLYLLKSVRLLETISEDDANNLVKEIYTSIIATGLERSFPLVNKLNTLLDNGRFSWDHPEDKTIVKSLMSMFCAICVECKKNRLSFATAKALYEEFYKQGDLESKLGYSTLPHADREMKDYMADCQLEFLRLVCQPVLEVVVRVLPGAEPLRRMMDEVLDMWEEEVRNRDIPLWRASAGWKRSTVQRAPPIGSFSVRLQRHLRRHFFVLKPAPSDEFKDRKVVFKINQQNWDKWYTKIA